MPKREGPVHVATTTRRYGGKVYQSHLLRRTFRQNGKVKHQTVGNLSHLPPSVIDLIRNALRGEASPVPGTDNTGPGTAGGKDLSGGLEILRSLPHGHVAAVLGTLRKVGLDHLLGSRPSPVRSLAIAMVIARIIAPASKLATVRDLQEQTRTSSLALELGLEGDLSEDDLYKAMDWLLARQGQIEKRLADRHLKDGSLILYDVTSSYYTGAHCPLARFGHNRDGDNGYPQIVYGLLCNAEGCPVAVEVFEGNTGDPKTLGSQIDKIRGRFHIQRVILVGDRGLITHARIREELRGLEGLDWITALRAPAVAKLLEQGVIQLSLFDQHDLAEVHSPDYPGERLVVCRNPLLAEDRARTREELLLATEKELAKIAAATQRKRQPLKGKDQIGLRVGRTIHRFKVAKHFILEISDSHLGYRRDLEKIAEEAKLDGLYVIRTSVPKQAYDAPSTVRAYKDLSKVERAFRCLKTVDLKVRPIHHRMADRVRSHVFLCMLAYYVEWTMRLALAPVLFDDDDRQAAQAMRLSIVAPAQRSPSAQRKASTKRTDLGQPVHSFHTLLRDLSTITKNRVHSTSLEAVEFYLTTRPTQTQQRALDLLGVRP
jgi:hypothetical protein